MRTSSVSYLAVGLFVLAMVAGLVASVAVLTGRTGATDDYFTVYRNVTGVEFGTKVLYEGYPIGQVEQVTPQKVKGRMRFRVDFSIEKDWIIPADSVATVAAPGLLSAITISIRAGQKGKALAPGSQVKGEERTDIIAVVSTVAEDLGDLTRTAIKPLIATVEKAAGVFSAFVAADARGLTRDLSALTADLARRVPKIATDVETVAGNLIRTSERIDALFANLDGVGLERRIDAILGDMETAGTGFAGLALDLHETRLAADNLLGSLRQTTESVDALVNDNRLDLEKAVVDLRHILDSTARNVDGINRNLEGASRNMYEFSRQIRQNPGVLLGGAPPPDAAARR